MLGVAGGGTDILTQAEHWSSPAPGQCDPLGCLLPAGDLGLCSSPTHMLDGIRMVKVFILTVCFTFIVKTLKWFTGIRVRGLSPTQTVG